MATSKSAKVDVSKARLLALKKVGLLTDVSARGTLTDAQKKKVRTAWTKNHAIATAAPGTFKTQDVSDFFPGQIKAIQKSGIHVVNGKAFIRTDGYKSAKIVKEKYKSDGETHYILGVRRHTDKRKSQLDIIGSPTEMAEWRERLLRDYEAGKFKEGQYLSLRAFDNAPMSRLNAVTMQTVFNYESRINYHDNPDKVREGIRLVIIDIKVPGSHDINTKDRKQKRKESRVRAKNEKKTGTRKLSGRVQRK